MCALYGCHKVIVQSSHYVCIIMKGIRDEYGIVEDQADNTHPGPFSVYAWVKYMAQDKIEADGILIKLIASMCGCRITIVHSDSCKEVRFKHNKALDGSDFGVLCNCSEKGGGTTLLS